jgi:hypothetical protein
LRYRSIPLYRDDKGNEGSALKTEVKGGCAPMADPVAAAGWRTFVDAYQPLVGSLIALAGVMLTLSWNAWQARKAEAARLYQERLSLLAALYAELANVESIIAQANRYVVAADQKHFASAEPAVAANYLFQLCPRTVYEKNADKLGRLGRKLSYLIVTAYTCVAEFEAIAAVLTSPAPQDLKKRAIAGPDLEIAAPYVKNAVGMVVKALHAIKKALPEADREWLVLIPERGPGAND